MVLAEYQRKCHRPRFEIKEFSFCKGYMIRESPLQAFVNATAAATNKGATTTSYVRGMEVKLARENLTLTALAMDTIHRYIRERCLHFIWYPCGVIKARYSSLTPSSLFPPSATCATNANRYIYVQCCYRF